MNSADNYGLGNENQLINMKLESDEGLTITIRKSDAKHGIIHSEVCGCAEVIQVGADEDDVVKSITDFLGTVAKHHNGVAVGCMECGWEGFYGPGDQTISEGTKAVLDEAECPECSGDMISLEQDECDHEISSVPGFEDEEDLIGDN